MLKRWNEVKCFNTLAEASDYIKKIADNTHIYSIEIDHLRIMYKWIVEIKYKAICEGGDK